ncbi:MAG: acyl carrier protein [Candidatus Wallbacteria bacterium HGW-Wallbacteria-1]|jgi:acyl carrier protein|uniref:Acyl carrier protein n=1 Tax=Candidatus Wallbacteria bacterium HGW-Wallbacteria-1 TaxID=2013854 RepID=A0A2N1PPQ2_9BACT|nr:MAG: acyl carrier protein [Candidatus Wallbacteria bacterium HGW-Wallbacteria-1]
MDREAIFAGIKECLMDCIRVDEGDISPDSRLITDLGADSLDLLDIIFSMERHFGIKIKQGEIEKRAREGISPEDFEENELLKPMGVKRLREILPEVPSESIREGMHISQIPYLFTVETFIRIVERSLSESGGGN